MLLVFALLILAVDICNGGKVPISECTGDKGGKVTMKEIDFRGYPPVNLDNDVYMKFKFEVSEPTSADLVLNSTTQWNYRCGDRVQETATDVCNEEKPYNCVYLMAGVCKQLKSLDPLKYSPCEKHLSPGDYEVSVMFPAVKLKCKIISAEFTVKIMDGSEKVGCFFSSPEFEELNQFREN